jgi:universal stress protein E
MSNRRWKSFLVAVRDIEHPPRALLAKAARIAAQFNGRLELLHIIAMPYVLPGEGGIEATKAAEQSRQLVKLERVANRLRKVGIKVGCSVVWDYPAADAIVRHVMQNKPDVVLAESHHHSKIARWFVTHTDWELIRSCPCPLWLVKAPRLHDATRVLAAIDPFHTHSKPAALDEEELRVATIAAGDGRLGVAHVFTPPVVAISGGLGEPIWAPPSPAELRRSTQRISQAVNNVADRHDIKRTDRIVRAGDAGVELPLATKAWKATLLVMGAVSRSALKRAFIGHTAERVIDAVNCDVLIVKPRSFKTSVNRRVNSASIPMPPM